MKKSAKIFIAGHNGLVGSAVHRNLLEKGYNNLFVVSYISPSASILHATFIGQLPLFFHSLFNLYCLQYISALLPEN